MPGRAREGRAGGFRRRGGRGAVAVRDLLLADLRVERLLGSGGDNSRLIHQPRIYTTSILPGEGVGSVNAMQADVYLPVATPADGDGGSFPTVVSFTFKANQRVLVPWAFSWAGLVIEAAWYHDMLSSTQPE